MKLKWDSLDSLTAIGCGWGAYAIDKLDGGIIAGAIVGGASLLGELGSARQQHGLNDGATFQKHQRQIIQAWELQSNGDWLVEAELEAADYLLSIAILDAVPPLADLGRTVVDGHAYPQRATAMILERLAEQHPLFGPVGVKGASQTARAFASTVIEASLKGALDDPEYSRLLVPHMLVGIGEGVAQSIVLGERAIGLLNTLVERGEAQAKQLGVRNEKLIALATMIVDQVDDEDQAEGALKAALEELIHFRQLRDSPGLSQGGMAAIDEIGSLIEVNRFDDALEVGRKRFEVLDTNEPYHKVDLLTLSQVNMSVSRITYSPVKVAHWALEAQRVSASETNRLGFSEVYEEALKWSELGGSSGLAIDKEVAVQISRRSVHLAKTRSDRVMAMNHLVVALNEQTDILCGKQAISILKEAIRVSNLALSAVSKKWGPGMRAGVLANLAGCQLRLAENYTGKTAARYLDESIKNFEEALDKFPTEILPQKRALIKTSYAHALGLRGVRRVGVGKLQDYEKSIALRREALQHLSPDRELNAWISGRVGLASGLFELGRNTDGHAGLAYLQASIDELQSLSRDPVTRSAKGMQVIIAWNLGVGLGFYGLRRGGGKGEQAVLEGQGMLLKISESDRPEVAQRHRARAYLALGSIDETAGDQMSGQMQADAWSRAEQFYMSGLKLLSDDPSSADFDACSQHLARLHGKKIAVA